MRVRSSVRSSAPVREVRGSALVTSGPLAEVPIAELLASGGFGRCANCTPGDLCPKHVIATRDIAREVGEPATTGFTPTGDAAASTKTQVLKVPSV